MVEWKYGYVPKDISKVARSYGVNLPISYKHAVLIARAIRGKKLNDAYMYLDDVISKQRFVPFVKFNKSRGHKPKNNGMAGPGGYPIKACKAILKVLKNAEKNAEKNINLDIKKLKISYISALKGSKVRKLKPKGRRAIWEKVYTHISVVLEEEESNNIKESEKVTPVKESKNLQLAPSK